MVGAAAGGLGGAALRTTMVVGARLGAIRQFGALSGSLNIVNNRFLQTGLGAANLVGTLSLLGGITSVLGNPVTGLLGALGAAAASIDWVGQEKAARRAGMQLRGWKEEWLDEEEIGRIIENINHIFGKDIGAEILNSTSAMEGFVKLWERDEPMAKNIAGIAAEFAELKGLDPAHVLELMSEAAMNNGESIQELAKMIGEKDTDGLMPKIYEWSDVYGNIQQQMSDGVDLSNTEEVVEQVDDLQNKWGNVWAEMNNVLALIPLALFWVLNFITDLIFEWVGGFYNVVAGLVGLVKDIIWGILMAAWLVITGQWDELGAWFKDEWWEKSVKGNIVQIVEGILGIFGWIIPEFMLEWFGLMDWWKSEVTDRARTLVDWIISAFKMLYGPFKVIGSFLAEYLLEPILSGIKWLINLLPDSVKPDWAWLKTETSPAGSGSTHVDWGVAPGLVKNPIEIFIQIGDEILRRTVELNQFEALKEQGVATWRAATTSPSGRGLT